MRGILPSWRSVLQVSEKDSTTGPSGQALSPGIAAEQLAARFLERQGLTIVARNYRCRGGEVDLICRDGLALVFVEVRLRRSMSHGGAAASITAGKQRRIVLAARHYLACRPNWDRERDCRFDCLLLDRIAEAAIIWIRDAFSSA